MGAGVGVGPVAVLLSDDLVEDSAGLDAEEVVAEAAAGDVVVASADAADEEVLVAAGVVGLGGSTTAGFVTLATNKTTHLFSSMLY